MHYYFIGGETDKYIFRFNVGMNHTAYAMQIIQAQKNLPNDRFALHRTYSLKTVLLDHFQEIDSKYLEDHNKMVPKWSSVNEHVE